MDSNTSIGQPDKPHRPDEDRATQATTEGVDAQNANEFDSRHALAGAEAKPFSPHPGKQNYKPLDDDQERERLQPGANTHGTGGAGADPHGHHEDSNSNT